MTLLLSACGKSEMQINAEIELEVAIKKSDIEAIYTSSAKLKAMGADANIYQSHLELSGKGLATLEELKESLSDHNHEEALSLADDLLNLYPKNKGNSCCQNFWFTVFQIIKSKIIA